MDPDELTRVEEASGSIVRLLASRGAPIEQRSPRSGNTPFLTACSFKNLGAARALAELGADIWAAGPKGAEAYDLALDCRHGRYGIAVEEAAGNALLDWLDSFVERAALLADQESAPAAAKGRPRSL